MGVGIFLKCKEGENVILMKKFSIMGLYAGIFWNFGRWRPLPSPPLSASSDHDGPLFMGQVVMTQSKYSAVSEIFYNHAQEKLATLDTGRPFLLKKKSQNEKKRKIRIS